MANYDSVLERTAVVIVVDDSKLQSELKKATDQVKRAAKDQGDAQKTVAKGTGDAEKGFAELRAEITRLRAATERVKREATAYLDTQKRQAAAARADAAAQKELDGRIKELGLQVRNTRSAFINGRIASDEFTRSSEALKGEINELLNSTTLTTAQQLKLNIASATAQRGLSSVRGEASRLGLAWNTQIALSNQFGQQLRNLGPVGAAAAGGLGLVQNGFAGLNRPIELGALSLDKFVSVAARAPQVLALATAAATTFAVVGLARLATNAAKVADEIDKASQSAGLGAEAFQEITFALSQNGVSLENARQGLNDFNARLGQAARGSTGVAKAYADLGVAIRDTDGNVRDSEAVFTDLIGALSGVESAALQAAIGGQVFGEEFSRRLLPTLNAGAEGFAELRAQARELGLVISGDSIISLVKFKDEMAVLQRQFETARVEIAAAFLPILRDVLMPLIQNTVIPWVQTAADRVSTFATRFTEAGTAGDTFRAQLVDLITPLLRIADVLTGVGLGFVAFANFVGGATAAAGAALGTLSVQLEAYIARLRELAPVFSSIGQIGVNPIQAGIDLVRAFRDLPAGAGQSPFDGAAIAESASAAGASFFERGNAAALSAGEAFGRAFVTGYDGILDDLATSTRDAFARGASGAFGAPPPGATPPPDGSASPAGTDTDPVTVRVANADVPFAVRLGANAAQATAISADTDLAQQAAQAAERTERVNFWLAQATGNAELQAQAIAIAADTAQALADTAERDRRASLSAAREQLTINADLEAQAAAIRADTAQAQADADNRITAPLVPDSLVQQIAQDAERRYLNARLAAAAVVGAEVAGPPTVGATEDVQAGVDQVVALARDTVVALIESGAGLDVLTTALGRLAAIAPVVADEFNKPIPLPSPGLVLRGNEPGGVFTPPTAPPAVQDLIDAGAEVRRELAEGAEATRLAAVETRQQVALAGLDFASNIGAAIRSGRPSAIFGAATDGIGSLISIANPIAGQIFSTVGGIFAGLLPNGESQTSADAQRAAGASARGAPSVELNLQVFQNLAVQSLTGGDRAAVDGLLDRTVERIESVLVSFGQRLTAVEARTA